MAKKKSIHHLGARERQILDIVYSLGEASVGDVHVTLKDAPSYSAVRTMIRLLESKGFLKHRQDGTKFVYRPTQSKDVASKNALTHLVKTFFNGTAADAVAALIGSQKWSQDDLERIEKLIKATRKRGR